MKKAQPEGVKEFLVKSLWRIAPRWVKKIILAFVTLLLLSVCAYYITLYLDKARKNIGIKTNIQINIQEASAPVEKKSRRGRN